MKEEVLILETNKQDVGGNFRNGIIVYICEICQGLIPIHIKTAHDNYHRHLD